MMKMNNHKLVNKKDGIEKVVMVEFKIFHMIKKHRLTLFIKIK